MEVVARAIFLEKNQILLCKIRGQDWYFLPGGHIEKGESIKEGLRRELKEELGLNNIVIGPLINVVECAFELFEKNINEVNFVFRASDTGISDMRCLEDHLEFEWIDTEKISKIDIRPNVFQKSLNLELFIELRD